MLLTSNFKRNLIVNLLFMSEKNDFSNTCIFQFAHESKLLLSYLSIDNPTSLWASFFTRVNKKSTDRALIDNFSDVFCVEVSEVDLKTILPEEQAYLVKKKGQWVFLTNVNHLEKDVAIAYVVHKKNEIENIACISFVDLLLAQKKYLIAKIFLLSFFINAFALTIPLYFNAIYGRIIPAAAESSLWTLSFIALLCFFCEFSLKNSKARCSSILMKEFNDKIQPSLYKCVVTAKNHIDNHWGNDKLRLGREIKELNSLLWGLVSTNVVDFIFIFIFFVVIYIMAGVLVAVPILIFSVQLLIGIYFSKVDGKVVNQNYKYESLAELDGGYVSGFSGMLSSLNYVREVSAYYKSNIRFLIKQNQMNIMYLIMSLQNILITITAFYLIQQNSLSIASLFAVVILSSRVSQSTSGFVASIPLLYQIKEKLNFINDYRNSLSQSSNEKQITTPFSWTLSNVSFGYQHDHHLFESINLKLYAGEKIAFVGNSGCGKTSLLKMISGLLVPLSGQVTLTGSEGERFSVDAIRKKVHYLAQEPLLYGESLMTHLCSESEYTDEQCKSALNTPLMNWLPPLLKNGLYTKFNELPYELPLPKKQMLAFSRFALTERDIWFFDSPTHLVDSKAQRLFIDEAKNKITTETSLFLFTDNVDLFELVERVIAFNDGKVIFDGPKDEFLTQFT